MYTEGKSVWLNGRNLLMVLVGVLVMFITVNALVDSRFQALELSTRAQISDQETLLVKIAEITARNGADEVTESIVRDCSVDERIDFDKLLSRLNSGLSKLELSELERLFGRCGSFFSERKLVMSSRFSREVEIYEDYVNQLSIITGESEQENFPVEEWKKLATEESKQGEYSVDLVRLQGTIINTLLAGNASNSDEILEILNEVKEVQENLSLAKMNSSKIKEGLISL